MQQQIITYNINMNGRMYDPLMSSFLSPDKYMQDPTTQQGFNRYAYCMYNPLKYVDPSGNRYFGYDEGAYYRMMEEMQQRVFHEWFSVCDLATASVQLTINMACGLFSHGSDTHGNGSGHHGSPGGGSGNDQNGQSGTGQGDGKPTLPSQKKGVPGISVANPASADYLWIKCHFHYMYGGQATFFVDASTIDFSNISSKNLEDNLDGTYSLHLFGMDGIDPQLGAALGEITLTYYDYDLYQIKSDTYNFDIHWNDGWTTRNIITGAAGVLIYGIFDKYQVLPSPSRLWGGEFDIIFINKVYIPHNP